MSEDRALVVVRVENTRGKRDASTVFLPESKLWTEIAEGQGYKVRTVEFGNDRYWGLVDDILLYRPRVVAYFGHGYRYGIEVCPSSQVERLGQLLHTTVVCHLLLFACNAVGSRVRGRPRFGEAIVTQCPIISVYGHQTAGHATKNPVWRRQTKNCCTGELVTYSSSLTLAEEREKLKDPQYRLWDLPFGIARPPA